MPTTDGEIELHLKSWAPVLTKGCWQTLSFATYSMTPTLSLKSSPPITPSFHLPMLWGFLEREGVTAWNWCQLQVPKSRLSCANAWSQNLLPAQHHGGIRDSPWPFAPRPSQYHVSLSSLLSFSDVTLSGPRWDYIKNVLMTKITQVKIEYLTRGFEPPWSLFQERPSYHILSSSSEREEREQRRLSSTL